MGVLPDWMIKRDIGVNPLDENVKREGKISYGVGSYGLDIRLGYLFKVFSPINATEIDPKNFDAKSLVEIDLTGREENYIRIPPHSFVLAESFETFRIPRDVLCIVVGKSTYARCGLIVNVTPLEPEWEGKLTIEISNTTPLPVRIYAAEGIAQCIFLRTDGHSEMMLSDIKNLYQIVGQPVNEDCLKSVLESMTCQTSYKDKRGKYQSQVGLTLPKVDEKV